MRSSHIIVPFLFITLGLISACQPAAKGDDCSVDDDCDGDLVCTDDVCDDDGPADGEEGGDCKKDDVCDDGLGCYTEENTCESDGVLGNPCLDDTVCFEEAVSCGEFTVCLQEGTRDAPCKAGACEGADLACFSINNGTATCRLPCSGGEACGAGSKCAALQAGTSLCLPTVGVGVECEGLACEDGNQCLTTGGSAATCVAECDPAAEVSGCLGGEICSEQAGSTLGGFCI